MSQEDQSPDDVSSSYVVSLSRKGQYLRFPEVWGDKFYFCIEAPPIGDGDGKGQDIAVSDFDMDAEGNPVLESATLHWKVTGADFVGKCVAQVTDFCVPLSPEDGGTRNFDPKNRGDNRANRELYAALRDVEQCNIRTRLNGAMDFVAGSDGPARKDFEELLHEQPQLLTDS